MRGGKCENCGAEVSPDAWPRTLCPRCLLAGGAESGGTGPDEQPTRKDVARPTDLDQTLGPYRILKRIGEGGMGEVYLALQEAPLRREVAIKVIKAGMDTRQVIARFEAERQALALMNHPSIARVLDAGSTPSGRPYFAMEYVPGIPITEYCDRERLTTHARLELFVQVCDAVQHAHHKAVIHRDIKPSNVLVAIQDGRAVTKVIDFGVAKAIAQRLTERTLFTELGVMIGTPEYMSPEQADLTAQDVDTRTDVYSLGVLLYELLVGVRPFDARELREAGLDEIRRRIREVDPVRPSTRITTLGAASRESAERRRTDPRSWRRLLRGGLDWITMKALEKDRARRYGSCSELARDVERYLRTEPVTAGPPSSLYRARTFVRRNRAAVSAAAVVALTLVIGIVGTFVGFVRARHSERAARVEAETAQRVSGFLIDLFRAGDPKLKGQDEITVKQLLERGAESLDTELADQPVVQARLTSVIGSVYGNMGLYDEAIGLLQPALARQEELLGAQHLDVADTKQVLAHILEESGRAESGEQLRTMFEEAIAVFDARGDPLDRRLARTLNNYGNLLRSAGEFDEAGKAHERAIAIYRAHDDPLLAACMNDYALLLGRMGEFDRGIEVLRNALDELERLGESDSWHAAINHANLANGLERKGRFDVAFEHARRADEILQAIFGPHYFTGTVRLNLARLERRMGRLEAARDHSRDAVELFEQVFGPQHHYVAGALQLQSSVLLDMGRYAEAEPVLERWVGLQSQLTGPDSIEVADALNAQGDCLLGQGSLAEARRIRRRVLALREKHLEPDHVRMQWAYYNLAQVNALLGERNEALEQLRRALDRGFAESTIRDDDTLDSLRGDAEFAAIVAEVERRLVAGGQEQGSAER